VDALRQAITKAGNFGFETAGAVMASDAFFPFPDCVEIANEAGIKVVIQPGALLEIRIPLIFVIKAVWPWYLPGQGILNTELV